MLRKFIVVVLLTVSMAAMCQKQPQRHNREEWFKEMRQRKHDFIEKEIELTSAQRERFFTLYDQMTDRVIKTFDSVRAQEKALEKKGDAATDEEYMALARTMAEVKSREGAIETEYFEKFSQILSPRQLVRLEKAERKFNQFMMRQHAKSRKSSSDHQKR